MNAQSTISNVRGTRFLGHAQNLRFCLVDENKYPYTADGRIAHVDCTTDFVPLDELETCRNLKYFRGIGISIQASQISAIDVDKCFTFPFDISSGDSRARELLNLFQNEYCEFSFSGTGMRILFETSAEIFNPEIFYVKNSNRQIEFYRPDGGNRYVTITGRPIHDNSIHLIPDELFISFLKKYMTKPPKKIKTKSCNKSDDADLSTLLFRVKKLYYSDQIFQDAWFAKAPGSGRNESELDFKLLNLLFENITQKKEYLRQIFESSPYFKSKDMKHKSKWLYNDYRYFNLIFSKL